MSFGEFNIRLPDWVEAAAAPGQSLVGDEARMRLVIELSRGNVARGTGGPFAAAVFDRGTGRLIAPGVNLVVPSNCSIAHAEMVALALSQRALGRGDLAGCELLASTEPCAMCLGAVPWSGVDRLVCGARGSDARAVGFDEGDKPPQWDEKLRARGIEVVRDLLRADASAVLRQYRDGGGVIYGPRAGHRGER